jgi:hypothetical protein
MSKSTISTFELFQMFPDQESAICPHCQTHWTYRDGKWNAAIKRHGRYCQCPDNWKCTICKALILNPTDFAEYEKNGTHVACMEKELTGTEHFPPCEEWSHGWTNTETGVECSRCGVRRGNCPECGHDEHGAVYLVPDFSRKSITCPRCGIVRNEGEMRICCM